MNRFRQLIRALSPDCREAVRRQSDALDRPLPRLQRIGLRLHLLLCLRCARYGKQIRFLRTAAQHCEQHDEHSGGAGKNLSPEARERIKRALQSGGQ